MNLDFDDAIPADRLAVDAGAVELDELGEVVARVCSRLVGVVRGVGVRSMVVHGVTGAAGRGGFGTRTVVAGVLDVLQVLGLTTGSGIIGLRVGGCTTVVPAA